MNLLIGSMRSSSVFIFSEGETTVSPSSRSSSSVLNHISSSSSRVRASRRKRWFLRMERMLERIMHRLNGQKTRRTCIYMLHIKQRIYSFKLNHNSPIKKKKKQNESRKQPSDKYVLASSKSLYCLYYQARQCMCWSVCVLQPLPGLRCYFST